MKNLLLLILFLSVNNNLILFSQSKQNPKKITIGMIGKINNNFVFKAAKSGAELAAKELGKKYSVNIIIDWQTPEKEDVQMQASTLEKFARLKIDGIAIACTDAKYLTPTINKIVSSGIPVLCFDSDAPDSKRFAYFGADDIQFGKEIMKQLAIEMNAKGEVAILAGNSKALNQQLRTKGILEELKNYPNIKLNKNNIYNNIEIPEPSAAMMARVQKANPNITGWACQGSWPFQVQNAIYWKPGTVKLVAGNAVPNQLEYLKSGHVQALIGVNAFEYGYKSVEILLDKILNGKNPNKTVNYIQLTTVTSKNVDEWSDNWKKWTVK